MNDHTDSSDTSDAQSRPLESTTSSPEQPEKCPCRIRPRVYVALAIVVLPLAAGIFYAERGYWEGVWAQGTLFPRNLADFSWGVSTDVVVPPASFAGPPPFDISGLVIPASEMHFGGPPKDGIPALTNPKFIAANEATYLRPEDRVIGFVAGKDARAYPLNVLNYHEIVNDRVGDLPVAVTYCPLCDSCVVFDRRTDLGEREFGVSGLLYNSNVLMYDRGGSSESLWSQIMTQGISGPAAEMSLKALPLELTTWSDWLSRHPDSRVLSQETGHRRNYGYNQYGVYFSRSRLMFPAKPQSDRLPKKARVLGVWTGNAARAYPESAFGRKRRRVEDTLDGKSIVIEFNPEARSLRVVQADDGVQWMYSLWFAWYAMRPETDLFGS